MTIHVTYTTGNKREFNSIEEIIDYECVIELHCNGNKLKTLPKLPNTLHLLRCDYNYLTTLPELSLTLEVLDCYDNNLITLPKLPPTLQVLYCPFNQLTNLPELPISLKKLYCQCNKLIALPELQHTLQVLHCVNNQLTNLPISLIRCRNLRDFRYSINEIEMSPQITRFINNLRHKNINGYQIYNDGQNIHNSSIQESVRTSIERLTTRSYIEKYNLDVLILLIVEDNILSDKCKSLLVEYSNNEDIHSILLLRFSDVLWYVFQIIIHDFNKEEQIEIKTILNQEMNDAECKCFTGRMSRVINCLNGFSDYVNIKVLDSSQIGNIIVLVKEKLGMEYSIEKHKEIVETELLERGYDQDTITEWLEYIE